MKIGDQPADFVSIINPGLTKREYFIGCALQGLCANDTMGLEAPVNIVREAIQQADALLEALEKEKK